LRRLYAGLEEQTAEGNDADSDVVHRYSFSVRSRKTLASAPSSRALIFIPDLQDQDPYNIGFGVPKPTHVRRYSFASSGQLRWNRSGRLRWKCAISRYRDLRGYPPSLHSAGWRRRPASRSSGATHTLRTRHVVCGKYVPDRQRRNERQTECKSSQVTHDRAPRCIQ
jgi:hypothetical protein